LFKNNSEDEVDFCESYKSQILNNDTKEESSLFKTIVKILIILLLMALIVGIAIYGYEYYQKMQSTQMQSNSVEKVEVTSAPPTSIQISDDELVVQDEEVVVETEVNVTELKVVEKLKDEDIEKIANDVKLAIAKSEMREKNSTIKEKTVEKNLEVPTSNPEAKYLEDLANLSKEIDKERKK